MVFCIIIKSNGESNLVWIIWIEFRWSRKFDLTSSPMCDSLLFWCWVLFQKHANTLLLYIPRMHCIMHVYKHLFWKVTEDLMSTCPRTLTFWVNYLCDHPFSPKWPLQRDSTLFNSNPESTMLTNAVHATKRRPCYLECCSRCLWGDYSPTGSSSFSISPSVIVTHSIPESPLLSCVCAVCTKVPLTLMNPAAPQLSGPHQPHSGHKHRG